VLEVRDVSKRFLGVVALDRVSLGLRAGEVHALVGENGAGKSTLIKVMTGVYQPDEGEIAYLGQPVTYTRPRDAQAAGISTIYQEVNLVPLLSVARNLFLGREPKNRLGLIDTARMHREAAELLAGYGITVDVRRPLGELGLGIQQMVAIARAVSTAARVVIMDEPTSSLDEREVTMLFDTIRTLKREGVAVLFVSHRLDELYAICDRVTIMRDGRTIGVHPMAEVGKFELVQKMLGRALAPTGRTARTETVAKEPKLLETEHLAWDRRVKDVSLDVAAGEIVGLAGLLGAGRTETARLIFGLAQPAAGEIEIAGAKRRLATPTEAIEAGIGFCTEDRKIEGIVPEMSVRENLTLALLPKLAKAGIVDETKQRAIVDTFIQSLGIKVASPEQKIRELSGGNQQKVLLARWLCMNPRLLIIDEPTRGIDVGAKAEILKLLRGLAADGLGVLMISSELEELLQFADRITVLSDGKSVATMPAETATEEGLLHAMAHTEPVLAGDVAKVAP
jgi:galactofuranose transport system ATP-binding protein